MKKRDARMKPAEGLSLDEDERERPKQNYWVGKGRPFKWKIDLRKPAIKRVAFAR